MQCFSTINVPVQQRVAFWNDVAGDALMQMDIRPARGSPFEGTLYRGELGALGISRARSTTAQIHRTHAQVCRSSERLFLVNLANHGRFSVSQQGCEATLEEGDFTISDSGEPFVLSHHTPCDAVVIRVPEPLMRAYLPMPEDLAGLAISGAQGISAVASSMMRTLCAQMQRGVSIESSERVSGALLEVLAAACASRLGVRAPESAAIGTRRIQIKRFIEAGLHDPDLTVSAVSAAFRISARYVRAVFAAEGETVSAYILRRRLEECAKRMRDPLWSSRTISEIAFGWGFNSLGSFSRAFKSRYEVTPHHFREPARH